MFRVSTQDAGDEKSLGFRLNEGVVKTLSHVKVIQLFVPVEVVLLNVGADLVMDTFVREPHDEAGNRILLRQAGGFEDDA